MDQARFLVDAVIIEKRSIRSVAHDYGVSKSWVHKLVTLYNDGGYDALQPRSKRPLTSPNQTTPTVRDEIIRLRKTLAEDGLDNGAHTIAWHLTRTGFNAPSPATIWRILSRGGFIDAEPKKRPHTSYIRFEANLPNECWQADTTHWTLSDGTDIEILDIIDDHSRYLITARAFRRPKASDVTATFIDAFTTHGTPASVLTDNGAIFTAQHRRGHNALETALHERGIIHKHSRPYHPQTCGKIERFHQTLKKALAQQPSAATIEDLQAQLDTIIDNYNHHRPHRARGNITPHQAFTARTKAQPGTARPPTNFRVRTDRVDSSGRVTLRHGAILCHIMIGRKHSGKRIRLYVADLNVRIITNEGELLRHLEIDPTRRYQGLDREIS